MSELITLINYIAVSIFGSILSAAFCGIGKEKKQRNLNKAQRKAVSPV